MNDWNNIRSRLFTLGTHIHLAAERGAKGPTFPLPWVYINKNTNISSYQSVKNTSTDMSLFCLSPLYLFLYLNDFLLASQLPTCRCVEIVQLVSAACWRMLINNRYTCVPFLCNRDFYHWTSFLSSSYLFLHFFVLSSIPRYGELLVPYYNELAEAARSSGLLTFGHDHVGHGRSEGERVQVWSKVESQK